ncbi:nucleotidyltransferase [Acidaminobacter sp. JC074]|uniref:nucleotidyltransferase family protein n=1 Tax=Acidaminobacter sp. JC074 TaxID=2530199 RepID=UPI001F0DC74B|nr:nucleotidyltransferase domain-containing protein [Acidaminobacter sp. JC074]MCH4891152.1 nucleotidyltransferase [Acidaminobacter sp. JC074]
MLLQELLSKKNDILEIVNQNNGLYVSVFGSTVDGNSNLKSDVDFLIKFNDDASLFDLVEIKLQLEELLDVKVDVLSEDGLKYNEIGRNIKKNAIPL